jgi:hypothetical protein
VKIGGNWVGGMLEGVKAAGWRVKKERK